jgi:hypothetical protein
MVLASASLTLTNCEDKESEGVSRVTQYATITLNGDDPMFVKAGTPYEELGAVAKEGDTDVEVNIDYSGTYFNGTVGSIDTDQADIYQVTYSAVNKDGFPGSHVRTVVVAGEGDLVNSLEGLYTSTVVRTPGGGPADADYTDREWVVINKVDDNTYQISDAIGGYYDFGRAYGPGYAAPATFTVNDIASNDFNFEPFTVGTFGGEGVITSMEVDPATKTIHFKADWDGGPYTFDVTLTQVDF